MKNTVKIIEKFDWVLLNQYIEEGLIYANKHKVYDLWILNYTPLTTYGKLWNDYSLACRGLVIDGEGNVIARPFPKFKNYEEHDPSEIDLNEPYEIFEKMDGSLGILFFYEVAKKWMLATRGSFESEQAVEGIKILRSKVSDWNALNKNCTYLFEIIFPTNRIVVDYGNLSDMVLLTVIDNKTGWEYEYDALVFKYHDIFSIVNKYYLPKVMNLGELRVHEVENKEGFVLKFANGFRVKVKFLDYCRLHSIITNVSNVSVWEMLKEGKDLSTIIENVPDEFYDYVKRVISDLKNKFKDIQLEASMEFIDIILKLEDKNDRKAFALEAVKSPNRGLLFCIYSGKNYDDAIWKTIRPKWSKPFKEVVEE